MRKGIYLTPGQTPAQGREIAAAKAAPLSREQIKLGHHYACVCGEPLVLVPFKKTINGPMAAHFRAVSRVPHEQNNCPWLTPVEKTDHVPEKHNKAGFKDMVQQGFAVVLNLAPDLRGVNYSFGRLKALKLPDPARKAEDKIAALAGRYTSVPVRSMNDVIKTLTDVVDTVGHLDHVYFRTGSSPAHGPYETGLRPIKQMLFSPRHIGHHGHEVIAAAQALGAYQASTTRRDAATVGRVALFPVLMRVQPSREYMEDLAYARVNGEIPQLKDPYVRGAASRVHYADRATRHQPVMVKHSIGFDSRDQRAEAMGAFVHKTPVYALATPLVGARAYWTNPDPARPSVVDFTARVMPGMQHIGALPKRVIAALLATPQVSRVRPNPDQNTGDLFNPAP